MRGWERLAEECAGDSNVSRKGIRWKMKGQDKMLWTCPTLGYTAGILSLVIFGNLIIQIMANIWPMENALTGIDFMKEVVYIRPLCTQLYVLTPNLDNILNVLKKGKK